MSFIRPEALAALRRWGEPVLWLAAAAGGLWFGIGLLQAGAWIGAVPAALGALAAFGLIGAAERLIVGLRSPDPGPGIVTVEEGRIAYFGPAGGAVLAVDALVSVEIVTTDRGPLAEDVFWHLADETGQHVLIPNGARDAARLLDVLSPLPGFDHARLIAAMASAGSARFALWRRPDQRLGRST